MNRLPFREASFDAVVATATLHHSPEPCKLLGEIKRVLVPEGKLIAANEPLFVPWRDTPEEERKGAHEGAYPLWTWLRYLRLCGFHAYAVRVGEDASLHFKASPATRHGSLPVHELAKAAGRYASFLALALPRSILIRFRRFKAGRPMRPLPRDRASYLKARLGLMAVTERALPSEEANWGPGWYAPEGGEEPFRWCAPRSRLLMPVPASPSRLVLELATFHPSPRSDPVEVEVDVAGERIESIRIEKHGWERYELPVSRLSKKRVVVVTLRVRRGYFVPREMGLGEDRRLLGVACLGAFWEAGH
jgi:SAM-dependent methyltransferase